MKIRITGKQTEIDEAIRRLRCTNIVGTVSPYYPQRGRREKFRVYVEIF
jgi:hypothetical protein